MVAVEGCLPIAAVVAVRMGEVAEDTPLVAVVTVGAVVVVVDTAVVVDTEVATNPALNFVIRTPSRFWTAFSLSTNNDPIRTGSVLARPGSVLCGRDPNQSHSDLMALISRGSQIWRVQLLRYRLLR